MSNHCLHLDHGQKVSCGSPQQQMSSLWETNLVLTRYVDGLPPGCLYYWVFSLSHSLSFLSYASAISNLSLSFFCCLLSFFETLLVTACCIRFIFLTISIFKAILINTPFLPFVKLQYLCLHSSRPFFMYLFISLLLIFPSCSSSTHHLSPHSSHLLSKQLGFLNSRLWQKHTAHLSRQRVAMKWPTPQHCRVIFLYAVSMALTHLPLGRVGKKFPSSPCKAKRDCQI